MNIYERIRNRTSPEIIEKVESMLRAIDFAAKYHHGQMYGDVSYLEHLHHVNEVASRFHLNDDIQTAAYLHDILEDTTCTFEGIWKSFGWNIALLVFLVTDEPGTNRVERKEKTYPKIATRFDAILLKLCDRIANVEASLENNPKLFEMYKNEHHEFIAKLDINDHGGVVKRMVAHLNELFDEKQPI
jgi:(p)ppGpp synthase/HD superfamily hydrolase